MRLAFCLRDLDEVRAGQAGRFGQNRPGNGDLVVPRLNGVPYLEKPPLLYWSNTAAFRLPYGKRLPWSLRLCRLSPLTPQIRRPGPGLAQL